VILVLWRMSGLDNFMIFNFYTSIYVPKKIFMFLRNVCIILAIIFGLFSLSHMAEASVIGTNAVPRYISLGEGVTVNLLLQPEEIAINAIEGVISFTPDILKFVRIRTAGSILGPWIKMPRLRNGDTISFAGIIPNGFGGFINPFNGAKQAGLLLRVTFIGNKIGDGFIYLSDMQVGRNDGDGTLEEPKYSRVIPITVRAKNVEWQEPKIIDTDIPDITAYIIQDPNIFNGEWTLIFYVSDKTSEIDRITVREGGTGWITTQSPYKLRDQTRRSLVTVRAYDTAGNMHTLYFGTPIKPNYLYYYILILLCIILLGAFIIRNYVLLHRRVCPPDKEEDITINSTYVALQSITYHKHINGSPKEENTRKDRKII